jgi:hypothetical protein
MLWFLALLLVVGLIGEIVGKLSAVYENERAFRERRAAVDDFYREQSVNELRALSSALGDPEPAPLSRRIMEVRKDLRRRHEVQSAMEKELGVK